MKVKGSIFIDKEGIVFSRVNPDNAQTAIKDFSDMLEEAVGCGDKYYYVYSGEWEEFFTKSQCFKDQYWKGAGQIAGQLLFNYGKLFFQPQPIKTADAFDKLTPPRTHGGFHYIGCPLTDYVYDRNTIDIWHNEWFVNNPGKIDWQETNGIMPCYDKVIAILKDELKGLQKLITNDDNAEHGLDYRSKLYLKSERIDNWDTLTVVSNFYSLVMDRKSQGDQKIAYAKEIGSKICEANYYHREVELERMEKEYDRQHNRETKITYIFSIKKSGTYQFLSVDKRHGRFELCDESGDHKGEILFDGTAVNNKEEENHSLHCIEQWKRLYNK